MQAARPIVALLGRRETPADGVVDYCTFLGRALERHGVELAQARVAWAEAGWIAAWRRLWRDSAAWRDTWVVLQYTAMSWSRRGFPFPALLTLAILRWRGARCAVLFHEAGRQGGLLGWRGRIRGACQDGVVRALYRRAGKAIFTIPLGRIGWLPTGDPKAVYIPIGANIPERFAPLVEQAGLRGGGKTVAVFCLSPLPNLSMEIGDLAQAAGRVRQIEGGVRFVILGKGSQEARAEIERMSGDTGVPMTVLGMLPGDKVAETLARSDVLLYLYGCVSQTRGSALAGVACGLPIVGYAEGAGPSPVEEAGVELVPYRNGKSLAEALVRVLSDDALRASLRERSRTAQQKHFAWEVIAGKFIAALRVGTSEENIPIAAGANRPAPAPRLEQ